MNSAYPVGLRSRVGCWPWVPGGGGTPSAENRAAVLPLSSQDPTPDPRGMGAGRLLSVSMCSQICDITAKKASLL